MRTTRLEVALGPKAGDCTWQRTDTGSVDSVVIMGRWWIGWLCAALRFKARCLLFEMLFELLGWLRAVLAVERGQRTPTDARRGTQRRDASVGKKRGSWWLGGGLLSRRTTTGGAWQQTAFKSYQKSRARGGCELFWVPRPSRSDEKAGCRLSSSCGGTEAATDSRGES